MDDYNNKQNGELRGFDEATNENGYTVTPDGGFYTKSREDIIQDEAFKSPEQPDNAARAEDTPQAEQEARQTYADSGANYSRNNNYNYGGTTFYARPPKQKKDKKKGAFGAGTVIAAALLAAVIGAGSGIAAVTLSSKNGSNTSSPITSSVSGSNVNINIDETAESVVEAVAKKVTPSVVGIRTTTSVRSFFGSSNESTGEGSGVVYSADGYIITNYHVISGAVTNKSGSKIEVFTDTLDSDSYEATVVGYNISTDLAVIKINAKGLTPAEFSDSSKLKGWSVCYNRGQPGRP